MATHSKRWKAVELEIAKCFKQLDKVKNSVRCGNKGINYPDVIVEFKDGRTIALEIKHRCKVGSLIEMAMMQIKEATANYDNSLPAIVVHKRGSKITDSLVVIKLTDFITLFK